MPGGVAETKYTVLVVDDDERLRHLVQVVLQNNGYKVEFADDGDALLPMVRQHNPDAVLLDLKMARMSGIEALQGLRSAGEDLGVIILSAAGDEALILAACGRQRPVPHGPHLKSQALRKNFAVAYK